MPKPLTFTVGFHNTENATVLPAARGCTVVLYCEVWKYRGGHDVAWRKALKTSGWGYHIPADGAAKANVTTWDPAVWEFIDGGFEQTVKGVGGITPSRSYAWARLRHRASGKVVRFVVTHLVSKARLRPRMWSRHRDMLDAFVTKCHERGENVVVAGDFNRAPAFVKLAPLRCVVASNGAKHGPIDQVWSNLDGGGQMGRYYESDHPFMRATLTLGAPAPQPDPEVPVRTYTPEEAIARARSRYRTRSRIPGGAGWCLREVRTMYGVPALYPDATTAWKNAKKKHRTERTATIPRGVPIFWTGGSSGHGHIAISSGDGDCYTTDLPVSGRWGWVRIDDITRQWGLDFVGYTEDLNGVTVWTPPRPAPKPEPDPAPVTRGPEVDIAILAIQRAKAKPGTKRDKALAAFLAAGLAVPPIKD